FDGGWMHENTAVLVEDGMIGGLAPVGILPDGTEMKQLKDGILAPRFVDLQVNGGGGVLFNDDPSAECIETICVAHVLRGTTSMLVTLISDTVEKTEAAVDAAVEAEDAGVPGFLGLHLEGPHLAWPGAHDPAHFRAMAAADLGWLLAAKARLEFLMVTVAPECAIPAQIAKLVEAGIVISLGHSGAAESHVRAAVGAGATAVTHLFNAMPPLAGRAPGLVGAALNNGGLSASIIADGIHVTASNIALAIRAKRGPGSVFLVSDAMPTVGADIDRFSLSGREVRLNNGRLTFDDDTLAGAHLDMAGAVRFVHRQAGVQIAGALGMATATPAAVVNSSAGTLTTGAPADLVHLGDDLAVRSVWYGGEPV
ncbi:MAG TPA: N-acetylglucosamine-6-phosphate deacetylase, partial [Devosiaceae bacterium]|nr:N-acetylglucosamine-6-phosphate deacetylase [Devosiaceae bacterium]